MKAWYLTCFQLHSFRQRDLRLGVKVASAFLLMLDLVMVGEAVTRLTANEDRRVTGSPTTAMGALKGLISSSEAIGKPKL
jgi:hypothetical protein